MADENQQLTEAEIRLARNGIISQFRSATVEQIDITDSGNCRIIFKIPEGYLEPEKTIRSILERWYSATDIVMNRDVSSIVVNCIVGPVS